MIEKLTKLYNTLSIVETKGESTKVMADCLRYVERMITDAKTTETEAVANNNIDTEGE